MNKTAVPAGTAVILCISVVFQQILMPFLKFQQPLSIHADGHNGHGIPIAGVPAVGGECQPVAQLQLFQDPLFQNDFPVFPRRTKEVSENTAAASSIPRKSPYSLSAIWFTVPVAVTKSSASR